MVAVYVIIALVFIVCGVWFDFILMGEAVTVFPWLISPICIVAMYIAIRMLRIRGKLQLNTVLIMLAVGGTIKLLVLMQIQPPNVWAGDDMGFVRGLAAYLPQLFNILIAYFTATLSDKEYMKKMAKAAEEATSILNEQIQPLEEFPSILCINLLTLVWNHSILNKCQVKILSMNDDIGRNYKTFRCMFKGEIFAGMYN